MIKPLLYLLHRGQLDNITRLRIIEDLLNPYGNNHAERTLADQSRLNIIIVIALDAAQYMDILINALRLHPQLCSLRVKIHYTAPQTGSQASYATHAELGTDFGPLESELSAANILVNTTFGNEGIEIILKAMSCGVPVLIPDTSHPDASFVRDGINGFLYRANDPDSLALSLLMLKSVSQNILQRVITQARETTFDMGLGNPSHHIAINGGRT